MKRSADEKQIKPPITIQCSTGRLQIFEMRAHRLLDSATTVAPQSCVSATSSQNGNAEAK